MFTTEYRDQVRHRVLELARADPRVTAGALTGSLATGDGDGWSDIDVAVTPAEEFGARGPHFRALFGTTRQQEAPPPPSASSLIGLGWHYVLHARSCIERHKPWQAEYWISGIRDHTLALACLRLGENALYGRGVDRLPAAVTDPLAGTLVRSLDEPELRRALTVATRCLIGELEQWDSTLCTRLSPLLQEFGTLQAEARQQRM